MRNKYYYHLFYCLVWAFILSPLYITAQKAQVIIKPKPQPKNELKHEVTSSKKKKIKKRMPTRKHVEKESEPDEINYADIPVSTDRIVDLGLSVVWSGYNFGATSTAEYGGLYRWGDIGKGYNLSVFSQTNPPTYNISGNSAYDITCQWGYGWRLPTIDEFDELIKSCRWFAMNYQGVNGYKVIGPNGKAIFLPAAGYALPQKGDNRIEASGIGKYWVGNLTYDTNKAGMLQFTKDNVAVSYDNRYAYLSIRPVMNTRCAIAWRIPWGKESVTVVEGPNLQQYSLVCGSFSLRTNAIGLMQHLKNSGYNPTVVYNSQANNGNGMYRVIAASYDNLDSVIPTFVSLRQTYPDCWGLLRAY